MSTTVGAPGAQHAEWRTWGLDVHVAVRRPTVLARAVQLCREFLDAVDRTCSRFRADSDLVRANRTPGRWVEVDPLLVAAVGVAVEAARLSDGLVTPCLGGALVALGYDADLRVVELRGDTPPHPVPAPSPRAWQDIGLGDGAIRVPEGCTLDLGATAKAWAADQLTARLAEELGCGALVSLGGDVSVADGEPTTSWPVRVAERRGDAEGQLIGLASGGLATSTTVVRRWRRADETVHHVIDPRTNRPATGALRTVSALGRSCAAANIASTAALVLGADAPAWLEAHGVSARLVWRDETVSTTAQWPVAERVP